MACGIIAPRLRIEPVTLTVEAQTANHWTTRLLLLLDITPTAGYLTQKEETAKFPQKGS